MDLTEGQKAQIKELIREQVAEHQAELSAEVSEKVLEQKTTIENAIPTTIEKKLIELENKKFPFWKLWTSPMRRGVSLAVLVSVLALVWDNTMGRSFSQQFIHSIAGTESYFSRELVLKGDQHTIYKGLLPILDERYSINTDSSENIIRLNSAIENFVNDFESQDHPLPPVIRKLVGRRPILVFHGDATFGLDQIVSVEFDGCAQILEKINEGREDDSLINGKACDIRASALSSNFVSIPFYAPKFTDPRSNTSVHVLMSVFRSSESSDDEYLTDENRILENISIRYVRTKALKEDPVIVEAQEAFQYIGDGFFYLELNNLVKDSRTAPPASLATVTRQTSFHSLEIEAGSKFLETRDLAVIKVLIFINRGKDEI